MVSAGTPHGNASPQRCTAPTLSVRRANRALALTPTVIVPTVRPRWLVEPQDVEVLHQEAAAVHCRASGYPEPAITWMKAPEGPGGGSPAGGPGGVAPRPGPAAEEAGLAGPGDYSPLGGDPLLSVADNGSVLLAAAQPTHAGRYMCQARNGIGPGISKVIHLRVNGRSRS